MCHRPKMCPELVVTGRAVLGRGVVYVGSLAVGGSGYHPQTDLIVISDGFGDLLFGESADN